MNEINNLTDARRFTERREELVRGLYDQINQKRERLRILQGLLSRQKGKDKRETIAGQINRAERELNQLQKTLREAELEPMETAVLDGAVAGVILFQSDNLRGRLPGTKPDEMEDLSIPLYKALAEAELITTAEKNLAEGYTADRTLMIKLVAWHLVYWCQNPDSRPVFEELLMLSAGQRYHPQ